MMAAAFAADSVGGRNVLVLEGQQRMGRKLLATGNGRCNMTNMNVSEQAYHSDAPMVVKSVLERFDVRKTLDYFSGIGIEAKQEEEGRVYPMSEQASSVLDMLRFEIERKKVRSVCDSHVTSVKKQGDVFIIEAGETYRARNVIIACGGPAASSLGADDSGAKLLASFGHKIVSQTPSLTQIKTSSPYIGALKGIRTHCTASLIKNGKVRASETGEVLFAEGALSGIAVFDLSRYYEKDCVIRLRLLPELEKTEINAILKKRSVKLKSLTLENYLNGLLNKRIANCVLKNAGLSPLSRLVSSLTAEEIKRVADIICAFDFSATGLAGWKNAQVTRGGASLAQFDECLRSRLCKGLYACGETLNVDGKCGGYNLQWAWSSGAVCAMSVGGRKNV